MSYWTVIGPPRPTGPPPPCFVFVIEAHDGTSRRPDIDLDSDNSLSSIPLIHLLIPAIS